MSVFFTTIVSGVQHADASKGGAQQVAMMLQEVHKFVPETVEQSPSTHGLCVGAPNADGALEDITNINSGHFIET